MTTRDPQSGPSTWSSPARSPTTTRLGPPDKGLVTKVEEAYQGAVGQLQLPVTGEDLLLNLLVDDPAPWRSPVPPLADLCAAAGLERRGDRVADAPEIWASMAHLQRTARIDHAFADDDDRRELTAALDALEDSDASVADLRAGLRALADPDLMEAVADELLGWEDDPAMLERATSACARAVTAASRHDEVAVAHWLSAITAERRREPHAAAAHLDLGLRADPDDPLLLDRAAWYASDRGDAPRALALWQRLGPAAHGFSDGLAGYAKTVEPRLGRNEACWCGSGRKYKYCHQGQIRLPPVADRVRWVCQKASWYLQRRGGAAALAVEALASGADSRPDEPWMANPVVIDVALTEGGWWERFVVERGPLLPDDEVLMIQSWSLVARTIYEIVAVEPEVRLTLRDLRNAELIEVTEHTFSRQAVPGWVICARAVPAGDDGHRLIGAPFAVTPGTEDRLFELLGAGDPAELCEWVGRLNRHPEPTNAELSR